MGELITNFRFHDRLKNRLQSGQKAEVAFENMKQLKKYHESMSMLDELTGLYNRRYFICKLKPLSSRKTLQQPLCLLVLDLDYFKQ